FEELFTSLAEDYINKGLLSKKDMWPLFTYVLSKGKVPENIGDFMGFFFWKNMSEEQWKFKTDRNMLTAILGEVADRVAKPAGVITAYVKSYEVTSAHFSDQCRDKIIGEPPEDPTELPGFAAFHE